VTERLFLMRHGEAEGGRYGVLLGTTDVPLSATGRAQCRLMKGAIPAGDRTRFACSPQARARETAEIVMAGRDATLEIDTDLREIDFGDWEGRTYTDVEREYPALAKAWSEFRPDFAFPGGESLRDFASRIERAAAHLAAADGETVVAFTHGGVIRALLCHFLGISQRDYLLFDIGLASVSSLRLWDGRGVLTGLRQVEGLPGGSGG
jgi:alpha-ribazole phosphatase